MKAIDKNSVWLPSKGLNERRATPHTYSHSEPVTLKGRDGGPPITGLGHFYRCSETTELRMWGFENAWGKRDVN